MKEFIRKFFKNKFNIALVVLESIALLCLLVGYLGVFACLVLFFVFQGVTCIVWGVKIIKTNSDITFTQQYYDELPYSVEQKKSMLRSDEKNMKSNKVTGWTIIGLGIVLIFMSMSFI
ncbi:MAG: hypothetical protein E7354_00280 [Clostridiales bacterium]|nr:hypothetical protein [Clostridiales bacterium]